MSRAPFDTLVVATHNRKKAGEMVTILGRSLPDVRILTLADFPGAPEPEETGTDYPSNATIKSESAAAFTGHWSLADDAGLEIDHLHGAPGVYSKRFGGKDLPFPEKIALILDRLKHVPQESRTARFRCCIALTPPESIDKTVLFEATCEGRIATAPHGSGGFGYDPIFFAFDAGCTLAELTADEKHRVSHRGKVLAMLADYLDSRAEALS